MAGSVLDSYARPLDDPVLKEVLAQHDQVSDKLKCPGFQRGDIIEAILDYVSPGAGAANKSKALVHHGQSGAGKTWLMSAAVQAVKQRLGEGGLVIYRLLGTTGASSSALDLICSVVGQSDVLLGNSSRTLKSWKEASELFVSANFLENAQQPVVLFLDSIDQLTTSNASLVNPGDGRRHGHRGNACTHRSD